ncbi:MAG: hypothetical protein MPJ24_05760 [Pirellulaceae bacterium]|nr:hypothetical protein [Pirellulaceae bacterium]
MQQLADPQEDIVISGIGVVSPIGIGLKAFEASLQNQQSGVAEIPSYRTSSMPAPIGAELKDFQPKLYIKPRKSLKVMCREIQTGVSAAALAMSEASLERGQVEDERIGVVYGSDMFYCDTYELEGVFRSCMKGGKFYADMWDEHSLKDLYPLWMLKYLPNMAACHVAIAAGAYGPNNSITLGEVSSLLALAEGASLLEREKADLVLVGGSGSLIPMTPMLHHRDISSQGFANTPSLAARPFARGRDGHVYGEGAATFVLEKRKTAIVRGAKIWGALHGVVRAFEPNLKAHDRPQSVLGHVLAKGREFFARKPEELSHLNAQGMSRIELDAIEARAIARELPELPVFAPSSYFGQLGAGGSLVEIAASLVSLSKGWVPATLNQKEADPACPIPVTKTQMTTDKRGFLKLGFSTTGQVAVAAITAE